MGVSSGRWRLAKLSAAPVCGRYPRALPSCAIQVFAHGTNGGADAVWSTVAIDRNYGCSENQSCTTRRAFALRTELRPPRYRVSTLFRAGWTHGTPATESGASPRVVRVSLEGGEVIALDALRPPSIVRNPYLGWCPRPRDYTVVSCPQPLSSNVTAPPSPAIATACSAPSPTPRMPPLGAGPVPHVAVGRPELLTRQGVRLGDMPRRVYAHRERLHATLRERLVVQVDERPEPPRAAADDGEHEAHPVARGARRRLRAATRTAGPVWAVGLAVRTSCRESAGE